MITIPKELTTKRPVVSQDALGMWRVTRGPILLFSSKSEASAREVAKRQQPFFYCRNPKCAGRAPHRRHRSR